MPSSTLSSIKIISTLGLGLLAGYSIASPFLVTPTIHSLSTRSNAPKLTRRQLLSTRIQSISAGVISAALLAVYWQSPKIARHPYLLYSAFLSVCLTASSELLVSQKVQEIGRLDVESINGEDLNSEFEWLVKSGYVASGLGVLAFAVSAIGNYGDYY